MNKLIMVLLVAFSSLKANEKVEYTKEAEHACKQRSRVYKVLFGATLGYIGYTFYTMKKKNIENDKNFNHLKNGQTNTGAKTNNLSNDDTGDISLERTPSQIILNDLDKGLDSIRNRRNSKNLQDRLNNLIDVNINDDVQEAGVNNIGVPPGVLDNDTPFVNIDDIGANLNKNRSSIEVKHKKRSSLELSKKPSILDDDDLQQRLIELRNAPTNNNIGNVNSNKYYYYNTSLHDYNNRFTESGKKVLGRDWEKKIKKWEFDFSRRGNNNDNKVYDVLLDLFNKGFVFVRHDTPDDIRLVSSRPSIIVEIKKLLDFGQKAFSHRTMEKLKNSLDRDKDKCVDHYSIVKKRLTVFNELNTRQKIRL